MSNKNIITKTYDWASGEIKETVTGVKKLVKESSKALKNRQKDRDKFMKGY
tara:strand:- start:591 stop:743 length:153 start_codon:yes stop_codon:yes gene_type:complete